MRPIYLDYQASTPLAPEVAAAMRPYLSGVFGNPHSVEHVYGQKAAHEVEKARAEVAHAIGARPSEVIFTSGATEANNTAIKGMHIPKKSHLVTAETEHACVLAAVMQAKKHTLLRPDPEGLIDPQQVAQAITPETVLVSIMLVNNEIGVIQPIVEIARLCHKHGVLLHVDAAQALGRIAVNVRELGVDMLSLSGHKIYGPKGIGALYIRRGVALSPLLHGGGQERQIRSGTLSPMLCAGMGVACTIAAESFVQEQQRAAKLREAFLQVLNQERIDFRINGSRQQRIADNLNLHFTGVAQNELMAHLTDIAVSSSAACSSTGGKGSHVLRALGHDEGKVASNIRLSFGRPTTKTEAIKAARHLVDAWRSAQ